MAAIAFSSCHAGGDIVMAVRLVNAILLGSACDFSVVASGSTAAITAGLARHGHVGPRCLRGPEEGNAMKSNVAYALQILAGGLFVAVGRHEELTP
jgi:hypothetical protein